MSDLWNSTHTVTAAAVVDREALQKRAAMFDAFVAGALDRFDDARERILTTPLPQAPALPRITPAAHALLQALSTGASLPLIG